MSADELHYKSMSELSELFRRRELLPSEVTQASLNRIDKLDGKFHGYAVVLAERAMAQAKKYDSEMAKGIWRGPLHGVPIGLKPLLHDIRTDRGRHDDPCEVRAVVQCDDRRSARTRRRGDARKAQDDGGRLYQSSS